MFNLVKNERKTWIFESSAYPTPETNPEIKGYNSLAVGFDSIDELKLKLGVHTDPCKHCGQIFTTRYRPPYDTILPETCTCFSCHLWLERSEQYKVDERIMIVNWTWYTAKPVAGKGMFRGHGGREFKFKTLPANLHYAAGTLVTSADVWCGGTIPEHLRHLFQLNSIII